MVENERICCSVKIIYFTRNYCIFMPIDAHKDSNIMFLTFNNCLELCNNMIGMKNCLNLTSAKRKVIYSKNMFCSLIL